MAKEKKKKLAEVEENCTALQERALLDCLLT